MYSAVGKCMLASLYDPDEDDQDEIQSVSMQHILARGCELIDSYRSLIPSFDSNWTYETEDLSEVMRQVYRNSGYIMHKANRLSPAKSTCGYQDGVIYARGVDLNEKWAMSGLGFYRLTPKCNESTIPVGQMFTIPEQGITEWWKGILSTRSWKRMERLPDQVEYLNTCRKGKEPYWLTKCPDSGIILAKILEPGESRYVLLKCHDGKREYAALEPWLTIGTAYLRISIALQNSVGFSSEANITSNGDIMTVSLKYLLPPEEQCFFELFSWPIRTIDTKWTRNMAKEIYPAFKKMLQNLGYKVLEA